MYIFCNILILFSSFANIIIGKFIWRESKNQFLRGEKWEDGVVTKKNVLRVLCICYKNENKTDRKNSPHLARPRRPEKQQLDPLEDLISHVYLRQRWNMASQALMCDKKALPSPWPSEAPLTKPAMSTTLRNAGTLLQWQKNGWRLSLTTF